VSGARAPLPACRGVVVSFDARAGLGEVHLDDGRTLGFHATAVADGTRHIEVGTAVEVDVAPGHRGAMVAASVRCAAG